MTAEELQAGYRWVYREFYSGRNILRRLPIRNPGYAARTLVFNLALKKLDRLWLWLRRWGLLYRAFHLYLGVAGLKFRRGEAPVSASHRAGLGSPVRGRS